MSDCPKEKETQHFKGQWYGFGPVSDCEIVIFAVFETTIRDGSRLAQNSFRNSSLAKSAESLARASYLTRQCFDEEIVKPGSSGKGALIGIACAKVADVRALRADFKTNTGIKKVRALCVLDRVDAGDYDGHATAGYAEVTALGVGQTQLGIERARIRLDLANVFSGIASPDHHRWPGHLEIFLKRIASIIRARAKSLA
jgi:hypothetical protein